MSDARIILTVLDKKTQPWREKVNKQMIDKALEASGVNKQNRYSIKDVQQIIGVSIESIRRMLRTGLIKGHKIGKNWLYVYHEDLSNLLEK